MDRNFVCQRLSGKSNNIEFRNCPGTQSWAIKRTVFGLSERSFRRFCKNEKERFSYLYSLKAGDDGKIHTLYEKTRERLLKNIAAYLLSQKYHPKGQTFVLLYRGQLLNWYGIDDAKGARSIWYFPRCVWGTGNEGTNYGSLQPRKSMELYQIFCQPGISLLF